MPNPNIVEAGKNTQFQFDNKAAAFDRYKNSRIRYIARSIAGMPIEGDIDEHFDKLLSEATSVAEILIIQLTRAACQGNLKAIKKITRIVDGPVEIRYETSYGRKLEPWEVAEFKKKRRAEQARLRRIRKLKAQFEAVQKK